jgi:CTP:molybdopterin cytidylyltransferase MocA
MRRITAVLLAAGLSTRMNGGFKQLMPYRGRTIVEACLETLLASTADDAVVVLGHRADEVAAAVSRFRVRTTLNPDYERGMSTSVVAGLRAIGPDSDAMMVALVDQPHLPVAVFDAVLDRYRDTGARVVVPTIAGDTGHPVIFDLSLRDEILAVDPAKGLRSVTYAHRLETLRVPVDAVGVLDDIDTPEDYERLS